MLHDVSPVLARQKPKNIEPLKQPTRAALPVLGVESSDTTGAFQTPEAVAALPDPAAPVVQHHESARQRQFMFHGLHLVWPPTKHQKIISSVLIVLLAFGIGAGWTHLHKKRAVQAVAPVITKIAKPKVVAPTTVASTLTGLQVDSSSNQRPVTGVMVENSTDARPQSGLDQAGVVFEAIAEGGITRFLALFQDTQPDYIGPVRSARPYYVQWCMSFDCALAHVGGSPEALADIPAWGTKNLDQFANAGAFERISTRYAPHNVYTSTDKLNQLEAAKGYTAPTYSGLLRKADAAAKAPTVSVIDMSISGFYYNVHYDYDAATNSYKRAQAGAPHMALHKDGSQSQISPKVVVSLVMQQGIEADDHHSTYNVIGSGQAVVFQDGTVTQATWSKSDLKTPLVITDAAGNPLPLNAGQTWFTAVSSSGAVTYK